MKCYNFSENSVITYSTNNITINMNNTLNMYLALIQRPFLFYNKTHICGVLMTLIVELSKNFGYRYVIY